jgi:hypothetical protein
MPAVCKAANLASATPKRGAVGTTEYTSTQVSTNARSAAIVAIEILTAQA